MFWEAYGINVNVKNKELTYVVEVLEYRNSVQYVKEMNALRRLVVIIGSNNEICTVAYLFMATVFTCYKDR